ncbi:MBOAT family protein [Dictyocaulus viviparus]|uniref:Lysophospholipid acyltransferase 5 n=1 Tax=Dictyocaulus viviparus TaxID=29172 RepID=A0A0D8Y0L5_DICVI|nr:MBOAT family protein [Dictyocaulus viviparus]
MVVTLLANILHTREDGLRLFLCVLAEYPLAAYHRSALYKKPINIQHIFFIITGLILHVFYCAVANFIAFSQFRQCTAVSYTIHSLILIVCTYIITNLLGGKSESIFAAHVCLLGYLLVGYWYEESDGYDIIWTTPFCVMTLRYIGLVMDVYDGYHYEKLEPGQKKTAITDVPGIVEIAAFGFFYSGTFVGPQFTLKKFRQCVNGKWLDKQKRPRQSAIQASLYRFLGGCVYMMLNICGNAWLPNSYFSTAEFYNQTFFWRWTLVTIWSRLVVSRYCGMWMIAEGPAILNGLGYNGTDDRGEDRWDGVRDIDVWKWETGHDFTSCIQSFNRGTNAWVKNNVMRRLRWLNSKPAAHIITLGYLAIWHGYHLGYFLLFGMEFGCVLAQEQLYSLIKSTPEWFEFNAKPFMRPFIWIFGRLTLLYSMGFGFLSFGLVKTKNWIGPVKSLYFIGYIFYFLVWPLFYHVLLYILPKKSKDITTTTTPSSLPSSM